MGLGGCAYRLWGLMPGIGISGGGEDIGVSGVSLCFKIIMDRLKAAFGRSTANLKSDTPMSNSIMSSFQFQFFIGIFKFSVSMITGISCYNILRGSAIFSIGNNLFLDETITNTPVPFQTSKIILLIPIPIPKINQTPNLHPSSPLPSPTP